jgi:phospholipase C
MNYVIAGCAVVGALALGCGDSERKPGSCDGPCPISNIKHVVVLVQENHTFDNYFARYCTAPSGSAPTCVDGPACCESGPNRDPSGASPILLDDAANGDFDPDHTQACGLAEMNGGAMDRYVAGAPGCSDPRNFAYADESVAAPYWDLARNGALADRYFQSIAGQSSSNNMYFVRAQFVFRDNDFKPDAIGQACSFISTAMTFDGITLGDLLDRAMVSWSFYVEGYQAMVDAQKGGRCPEPPDDCPAGIGIYPCAYDPSDVPIDYYENFKDNPRVLRDFSRFAKDLDDGVLPQVVFIRAAGYRSEHPGYGTTLSAGFAFADTVRKAVANSAYASDTLVLFTWDEGGGYFDHIAPPPNGSDGHPYGTRVPLLAIGPFARPNAISHVTMEHSSVVKFVEWNWLGGETGQLGGRDVAIANIGSLLDPTATGSTVP